MTDRPPPQPAPAVPPPPRVPRLLAISDLGRLAVPFPGWIRALAAAGVDGVQLREKDLDDGELLALARTARSLLPPPAALLVNGRLDVALAAGADGAHLPAEGLPAAPLLAWARRLGRRPLLGRSTHSLAAVAAAAAEGVDFVAFGPVFATPGKPAPAGTAALAEAARLGVPVLALGGIDPGRVAEAIAAGAHGVAAIRAFRTRRDAAAMAAAMAAAIGAVGAGAGC